MKGTKYGQSINWSVFGRENGSFLNIFDIKFTIAGDV